MHALVTGASGFLGGRLAQLLHARGAAVTVLARPTSDLRHLDGLPLRLVRGDLADPAALRDAVTGATHIFHCAACSTDWAPPATYTTSNVDGTRNLLAAAALSPTLERLLHVSTTDVYGYPLTPCAEDHPTRDAGLPYNQTKLAAEALVWRAHREGRLPVTIVRPATIYGPRGADFTLEISTLLRQRLMATIDGGRATGGFLFVDTCALAMIDATEHPRTLGEAYNLADGTGATWHEYVTGFAQELHLPAPWLNLPSGLATRLAGVFEATHRTLHLGGRPLLTRHALLLLSRDQEFPIHKAREHFGFTPAIPLAEGLQRSASWIRSLPRR